MVAEIELRRGGASGGSSGGAYFLRHTAAWKICGFPLEMTTTKKRKKSRKRRVASCDFSLSL
jgi:hypothetical protein